jgi:ribosomal protein S18 acetylase RimI-like enzyme
MLIRPARHLLLSDLRQLANPPHVAYTHLDWLPPEERLQDESTFALEEGGQLRATVNLAPETSDFAWLRFFFSIQDGKHQEHFQDLLSYGRKCLAENKVHALYSLSHHDWFESLLIKNGFSKAKQIIALTTNKPTLKHHDFDLGLIQTINAEDISLISHLDTQCFSAPWQLSRLSLRYCIGGADLATCIKLDGQAVAYQVSHVLFDHVHIARLAVHPDHRGKGYATTLLTHLVESFDTLGNYIFSVNTQEDNLASIGLYEKLGFQENQESFPVFKLKTS